MLVSNTMNMPGSSLPEISDVYNGQSLIATLERLHPQTSEGGVNIDTCRASETHRMVQHEPYVALVNSQPER